MRTNNSKMRTNLSKCEQIIQNANKSFKMQTNNSKCEQIIQNGNKSFKMRTNLSKCEQIIQNANKSFKMRTNNSKCEQIFQNANKSFKMQTETLVYRYEKINKCFKGLQQRLFTTITNKVKMIKTIPTEFTHHFNCFINRSRITTKNVHHAETT